MRPFLLVSIFFAVALIVLDALYLSALIAWWWIVVAAVVYLHTLVLGSIFIGWNFYLKAYNKGDTNSKEIALTFDDGPAAETATILTILKEMDVKAAFFTIGKRAAAHPEMVKQWHADGHLTGNHSYNHGFNFDWQSTGTMAAEIRQTNDAVLKATGVVLKLFRPPYGVTNPNLAKAVRQTGMYAIGWNIRSFDTKAKDPQQLLQRILNQLKGGDIILLHDSMPITAQILTELIERAQQKGFIFVRVDKLLGLDAYA